MVKLRNATCETPAHCEHEFDHFCGTMMTIGSERFRYPESMFTSSFVGTGFSSFIKETTCCDILYDYHYPAPETMTLFNDTPLDTNNRETLTSNLFKTLNVPKVLVGFQSLIPLYSSGLSTDLDPGYGVPLSMPIYEGHSPCECEYEMTTSTEIVRTVWSGQVCPSDSPSPRSPSCEHMNCSCDEKCDVLSLGVMMYTLMIDSMSINNYPPARHDNNDLSCCDNDDVCDCVNDDKTRLHHDVCFECLETNETCGICNIGEDLCEYNAWAGDFTVSSQVVNFDLLEKDGPHTNEIFLDGGFIGYARQSPHRTGNKKGRRSDEYNDGNGPQKKRKLDNDYGGGGKKTRRRRRKPSDFPGQYEGYYYCCGKVQPKSLCSGCGRACYTWCITCETQRYQPMNHFSTMGHSRIEKVEVTYPVVGEFKFFCEECKGNFHRIANRAYCPTCINQVILPRCATCNLYVRPFHFRKFKDHDRYQSHSRNRPTSKKDYPSRHNGYDKACADCPKPKSTPVGLKCICGRPYWDWCYTCSSYNSQNHFVEKKHHKRKLEEKPKRKKAWKAEQFPSEKGRTKFYCADCKINCVSSNCSCGRKCWSWCDSCSRFRSPAHDDCDREIRKHKTVMDFPMKLEDEDNPFHCGACKKNQDVWTCRVCKGKCWKWCDLHRNYFSERHKCFKNPPL